MRRIGGWIAAPFVLLGQVIALLWRAISEVFRAVRWTAYYVARFVGSGQGVIACALGLTLYFATRGRTGPGSSEAGLFYFFGAFGVLCRLFWRGLKPGERRVRAPKVKPYKPPPIPVVRSSARQSDDPSEAAMISRLPANLQSLLADAERPAQRKAAE